MAKQDDLLFLIIALDLQEAKSDERRVVLKTDKITFKVSHHVPI